MTEIMCEECWGEGRVEYITNLTYSGHVWTDFRECEVCLGVGYIEVEDEDER